MTDEQPQRPERDNDRAGWCAYWTAQGMPWRTEPEIEQVRQRYLAERREITPDIEQGIYPFKDVEPKLTRADVEWLLATHERGGMVGPVDWHDPKQRHRQGLDLRGADLRGQELRSLPLACLLGGLAGDEWVKATPEQRDMALSHVVVDETHSRLWISAAAQHTDLRGRDSDIRRDLPVARSVCDAAAVSGRRRHFQRDIISWARILPW
jgi:hypothetical protein